MGRILPNGKHSRHNPAVPDIGPQRGLAFTTPGQQSFAPPRHPDPNDPHQPTELDIRGKIGQTVFQMAFPPHQCTWYPHKKLLQRRRHVMPFDPRTMPQLRCRARWAAGVAAWQQLTNAEKEAWEIRADRRAKENGGRRLFMRVWCEEHSPEEYELQALLWTSQPELPFLK